MEDGGVGDFEEGEADQWRHGGRWMRWVLLADSKDEGSSGGGMGRDGDDEDGGVIGVRCGQMGEGRGGI